MKTSLALNNLRAYAILIVLAFHSSIAYVSNQPAAPLPFDVAPYGWIANPIVDSDRWLGLDLFCAFQFLYMMQLMFFLSGLFAWPSLKRKGGAAFLFDRFLRLGVPFALGACFLMPLAYYAVYRETAVDPSWSAYWVHLTALPFWPAGPLWFLWILLLFNVAAVVVFWLVPRAVDLLARPSTGASPNRLLVALMAVSAVAALVLAAVVSPWKWIDYGPFSFQPFLLPQFAVYFGFGLVVGAYGLDRCPFTSEGVLAKCWGRWLSGTLAAFALWLTLSALIFAGWKIPGLQVGADLAQVAFAATTCFAASAIFLRFAAKDWPILDSISENAYGIYLFHYVFVLWTQFVLLGIRMPAIAKCVIVFGVAVALSWAATAVLCTVPFGARIIRGQRRISLARARSGAESRALAAEAVRSVDRGSAAP